MAGGTFTPAIQSEVMFYGDTAGESSRLGQIAWCGPRFLPGRPHVLSKDYRSYPALRMLQKAHARRVLLKAVKCFLSVVPKWYVEV